MNTDLLVRVCLTDIEVAYWREVDQNLGRNAASFYTSDGTFTISGRSMHGREAITQFYSWRVQRGPRVARHVVTNFCLVGPRQENEAVLDCVMCLFAADGAPVLPSAPPIMIADIETRFVRASPDAPWLMSSHTLTPIFEGGTPATLPPDPGVSVT